MKFEYEKERCNELCNEMTATARVYFLTCQVYSRNRHTGVHNRPSAQYYIDVLAAEEQALSRKPVTFLQDARPRFQMFLEGAAYSDWVGNMFTLGVWVHAIAVHSLALAGCGLQMCIPTLKDDDVIQRLPELLYPHRHALEWAAADLDEVWPRVKGLLG